MMLGASLMAAAVAGLPAKTSGFYCLLVDDTVKNYTSTDEWTPRLYPFQETGANVLFLTFLHPEKMPAVAPAMRNLAGCRGQSGCPKNDTKVILSVGGQAYSDTPWSWLASDSAAEAMATKVAAQWPSLGVDGIDLDIEGTAGGTATAPSALLAFVKKLRTLQPDFIVSQPVYGFPQIDAENGMVNSGWDSTGKKLNTIDSVGIMYYKGLQSLKYVKNYVNATEQWQGFPITIDVPASAVMPGLSGKASDSDIMSMAGSVKTQGLGGFIVWFTSVFDSTRNAQAFAYGGGDGDATSAKSAAWAEAIKAMQ